MIKHLIHKTMYVYTLIELHVTHIEQAEFHIHITLMHRDKHEVLV